MALKPFALILCQPNAEQHVTNTKAGRNWCQSAGITLVLGRWTFFFNFKGLASWIAQKIFCRHLSPNYW
jgi:hypothetical protein